MPEAGDSEPVIRANMLYCSSMKEFGSMPEAVAPAAPGLGPPLPTSEADRGAISAAGELR
jgi:hypothetical protein